MQRERVGRVSRTQSQRCLTIIVSDGVITLESLSWPLSPLSLKSLLLCDLSRAANQSGEERSLNFSLKSLPYLFKSFSYRLIYERVSLFNLCVCVCVCVCMKCPIGAAMHLKINEPNLQE